MGMLAEQADHVIGVDTHRDSHAAAAVAARTGAVDATTTIPADAFGYKRLLRFGRKHAPGRRVWAIESSGSFGAASPRFCSRTANGSSRWIGPGGRRVATAPSPMSSTLSAPPTRRSTASISPSHASAAIARRFACC